MATCSECGRKDLSWPNLKHHRGSAPCIVAATHVAMAERKWERVRYGYAMCLRIGVEMERHPSRLRTGGDPHGRIQYGWWAPRWVAVVTNTLHIDIRIREQMLLHALEDPEVARGYEAALDVADAVMKSSPK